MTEDYELERTSLACAILSKEKLNKVMELTDDDYYDPKCKMIFSVIKTLYNAGNDIDLIAIRSELQRRCQLENEREVFLANIMDTYPVNDVDGLVSDIKSYSQKRKILKLEPHIRDFGKNDRMTNDFFINKLYSELKTIESFSKKSFHHISNTTNNDLSFFELNSDDYIKTGFYDFDKILFGLVNSELTIIGARPGLGKSAFALNIAFNIANDKNVMFISLEMKEKLLGMRSLSSLAHVDSNKIRSGNLDDNEKKKLIYAMDSIRNKNLYFVDDCYSLDDMLSRMRQFCSRYKNVVIIVDYIQLVKVPWIEQRRNKVAEISGSMKQFCNKMDIPIIALAQLSRNAEGVVPKLSDLKEAGDLEQDADNVVFLHNTLDMGNIYDLLVAKGRSSGVGHGQLLFDKTTTTFKNYQQKFEELNSGVFF